MITSFLGEMGNNPENIFKISKGKILFIFCIFIIYKVISISLDLTYKYLQFSLQTLYSGFQVECGITSIPFQGMGQPGEEKFILNCKYIFK